MRQRNQCDDEVLAAGAASPRLAVEGLSDEALQGAIQELMPEPDPDTVTLAPGPLGDDPGGGQPPGTVTV